jgi:hypothetical protein
MRVGANSSSTGVTARATIGAAKFLLVDGTEVKFARVSLDDEQLAELRSALEAVLPGRWRPPDTLHQPI